MLRSRLASLLLCLASPAVGGTLLPVAHPCPVNAPWLAQDPGSGDREHGGHHQESQTPTDQSDHGCTCPAMGAAGLAAAVPSAAGTVILSSAPLQLLPASVDPDARWT